MRLMGTSFVMHTQKRFAGNFLNFFNHCLSTLADVT